MIPKEECRQTLGIAGGSVLTIDVAGVSAGVVTPACWPLILRGSASGGL